MQMVQKEKKKCTEWITAHFLCQKGCRNLVMRAGPRRGGQTGLQNRYMVWDSNQKGHDMRGDDVKKGVRGQPPATQKHRRVSGETIAGGKRIAAGSGMRTSAGVGVWGRQLGTSMSVEEIRKVVPACDDLQIAKKCRDATTNSGKVQRRTIREEESALQSALLKRSYIKRQSGVK